MGNGEEYQFDDSYTVYLEDSKYGDVEIRYDEGAVMYSMGIHSFMDLAKEAKAVYNIKRICLVNTEKLDAYIEMAYGSTSDDQ